ncbi:MAG TPA: hypothetical protein DDY53_05465 [Clostridiales bacterium]|jgi:hypothetical protein|nr:hypothetical protein [Clostridiales bacterium]
MNSEELDKLRLDDIEFFARRYSELFSQYFDKNTPKEKEEFYKEIKEELLVKAPRYVLVDGEPTYGAMGISYNDRIEFSKDWKAVEDRAVRIHELFHSYNRIEGRKHGLRDFDNDLVLRNLDEGSTEMFAQKMCGNESRDTGYISEVKFARFLTSIVGERTMIRSTRGNPQLLCETTDRLLGTQDFLQSLEDIQDEREKLISQSFGEDSFWGTPIRKDVQILSKLKLEAIRGKDEVSILFDVVQQLDNQELYNNLSQTDAIFGYDVIFYRSLGLNDNKIDPEQPTIASTQQEILKAEIDELDGVEDITLQTVLEMEIKKFLYDRISYQKHFIDHPEPKYGTYELTPEDTEFSESFRSELDGASERLGGKIGLVGPGNRVYSLENTPYVVNEKMVKKMYLSDVGFDGLQDYRLELWAEKLNIAQTREFLNEWTEWTYNVYYKEMFPDGDEETFREAIEGIKRTLDQKEQGLVDKYKALENEKQQANNEGVDKTDDSIGQISNEENTSEIGEQTEQQKDRIELARFETNEFEDILIKNNVDPEMEKPIEEIQIKGDSPKEILEEQRKEQSMDLWMNRFNGWYSSIDRVSQAVKVKFVKMKSYIIKAISEKIKERSHKRESNKKQDQSER